MQAIQMDISFSTTVPRPKATARPAVATEPERPSPSDVYLMSLGAGSRRTMRSSLEIVARHLSADTLGAAEYRWEELTYAELVGLRDWLGSGHYRPSSANRHLDAVRGVLRAAWGLGLMSTDKHLRLVAVKRLRQRSEPAGRLVSAAEVGRLLQPGVGDQAVAGARDTAMLAVLFHCAVRPSELCALNADDVDTDEGFLRVPKSKSDEDRWLPLSPDLLGHLEPWLEMRGAAKGPLFCRLTQRDRLTHARLSCEGIRHIVRRRAGRAGIARLRPSDARRSALTRLASRVDLLTVQAIAGHVSPITTSRYDLRGRDDRRAATAGLWSEPDSGISPLPWIARAA